ncbi:PREDICTED: putative pentatricopeptide repeat-containing protein At1g10330 [Theobroma cacao]|uniref:Pentatricopeptide repeat-containing protein At1g10330 n=1 Tax=Theobroma cacao TaxID=3641 RepID=A0AB32V114_THECC|nr:PREDICTED: putative pentatricopeptide repeat-containing protein At1g10330 [Theobroma cacao]
MSSESLLQHLQRFIQRPNQIKQIHSLLITGGLLLHNHYSTASKWKTTLLYNTLIRAYLNVKPFHHSLLLFTRMLGHQTPPNSHTFPSLFKAAAAASLSLASLTCAPLHAQALKRGVLSDPFVQTSLLGVYAKLGRLSNASKVFEEIFNPCIVACNAMLDAFGRNGDMGSALLLFESMIEKDVVSWTSVINGFARSKQFKEAIRVFENMMEFWVKPNEATYVNVLSCCANSEGGGSLYQGKQIHGYMLRNEVVMTVYMGTALIDFYGKKGCSETAVRVFNQMLVREVFTWNAMISSLACNGREEKALDMFEKMKVEGVCPNEVTLVAVLTACARTKRVELGSELFQSMSCQYGIVPMMEHYGCMVDLLGRAGLLTEATEFIGTMPFQPDASVLGALLNACKIHGAIELGNEVGRKLLELQPRHCGLYVALSSINADLERWDRAADLRKALVEARIRKVPAYSLISSM